MGTFVCRCCGNPVRWNDRKHRWECDFCGFVSGELQKKGEREGV